MSDLGTYSSGGDEQLNQDALLNWFHQNQRSLPWRINPSPWSILLSEILLQQTQMERGIEYHKRLYERFPTPSSMAKSKVDEVLFLWQGAGYYSRARRLHALSQIVVTQFDGVLPSTYDELLALPGIGPYTAAAVASMAFSHPVACVDGNVRRVMARQTDNEDPSVKVVQEYADEILVREHPGDWNQAMMELGALVCRPRNPTCNVCPVRESCQGTLRANKLPRPKKQKKTMVELQCILKVDDEGQPELIQRPDSGLFAGLWGPQMEEEIDSEGLEYLGCIKHILSHRTMNVHVWKDACKQGIDPNTVALSTLDRRILTLGGVFPNVPTE
jgi:A/G-specific adenine glycosylase